MIYSEDSKGVLLTRGKKGLIGQLDIAFKKKIAWNLFSKYTLEELIISWKETRYNQHIGSVTTRNKINLSFYPLLAVLIWYPHSISLQQSSHSRVPNCREGGDFS